MKKTRKKLKQKQEPFNVISYFVAYNIALKLIYVFINLQRLKNVMSSIDSSLIFRRSNDWVPARFTIFNNILILHQTSEHLNNLVSFKSLFCLAYKTKNLLIQKKAKTRLITQKSYICMRVHVAQYHPSDLFSVHRSGLICNNYSIRCVKVRLMLYF